MRSAQLAIVNQYEGIIDDGLTNISGVVVVKTQQERVRRGSGYDAGLVQVKRPITFTSGG